MGSTAGVESCHEEDVLTEGKVARREREGEGGNRARLGRGREEGGKGAGATEGKRSVTTALESQGELYGTVFSSFSHARFLRQGDVRDKKADFASSGKTA